MKILAIETSCDETAAAVVEAQHTATSVILLSNVISTSLELHAKTGGIIPEIAARMQIEYIIPVIKQALEKADLIMNKPEIDAIAVTYGPGLIGSLLVGVETAKTLSYIWNKPLIPVNHLYGHIYANFITTDEQRIDIQFPALALIVSGGHTDLVLLKKHGNLTWLGGTRDDAAGEAMDKIGRLLSLPYPGGPEIERRAKQGNDRAFQFPKALLGSGDFDFSFSGVKTAVLREVQKLGEISEQQINDISASLQKAIIDVLLKKTIKAGEMYNVKSILLSGGVAANQKLRNELEVSCQKLGISLFAPPKHLCTDNAAMIGAAAFFNNHPVSWDKLTANPELYFD